ncbi:hypothetical protein QL285_092628 [Trifolium repens]|nr:hypothetical protein QL285_092628 [Trifolium repens]
MHWRATGIYGFYNKTHKFQTCRLINDLSQINDNPNWLIFGDFNIILNSDEKEGGNHMDHNITNSFRNTVDLCNLFDLGFIGHKYTLHNRQQSHDYIQARLDRFLATPDWITMFPNYSNNHLLKYCSDHCPILLEFSTINMPMQNQRYQKSRKFEQMWLRDEDHYNIVKNNWNNHSSSLNNKLNNTLDTLHSWGKQKFGTIPKKIKHTQQELQHLNDSNRDGNAIHAIRQKEKELDDLLLCEELWWSQRSRAMWLQHGDKNTAYFHQKANQRRRKNKIDHIFDSQGNNQHDPRMIEETMINHFKTLFQSQETRHI